MTTNASILLNPDTLIAVACEQTGLHDFGVPDVVEPLCHLTHSFIHEAQLTEMGVAVQQMGLTRLLVNRLRFQQLLQQQPGIRDEKLRVPIIIIGLPRSGTTKLQRMIASDPALQTLPFWRMLNPVPLPDEPRGDPGQRIAIAEAATAYTKENFPAFQTAHPMGAMEPEEEDFLMEHSFATSATFSSHRLPSHQAWVQACDPKSFYDLLQLFMQSFQREDGTAGKPWMLKATCHLHRLRWLLEAFPEATIVHCHRNPATSLTSLADMFYEVRKICSDRDDPQEVGRFTLDYSRWQMEQYFQQRLVLENKHRFVDVGFNDIVAKPHDVIASIYRAAGVDLTDEARAAMQRWEQENPQHKHGKRDYHPEKFGYNEARLRTDFAQYMERFAQYM